MESPGCAIPRSYSASLHQLSTYLEGAFTRRGALTGVFSAFYLFFVYNIFNLVLKTLHTGWPLLTLCIDLRPKVMQVALLLFLVAPLACLAAPTEKPSSRYHLICIEKSPDELSPTCYRRWRHHGHLTFRLARVQSCSADQQESSANTNVHPEFVHNKGAITWVG